MMSEVPQPKQTVLGDLCRQELKEYMDRLVRIESIQFEKVLVLMREVPEGPVHLHRFIEEAKMMVEVLDQKMYIADKVGDVHPGLYPDELIQMVKVDTTVKLADLKLSLQKFEALQNKEETKEKKRGRRKL
jgi:hypothetical protein